MTKAQITGLRKLVSSHINSIADAFFSLGGERAPDFVLGLTQLEEVLAYTCRSSSRQWVAFLRSHKLVSAEGAPPFKIFEHTLARPTEVFQSTSITPAAATDILLRACGGSGVDEAENTDAASSNFEEACAMALSRSSPAPDIVNQPPYLSLAQFAAALCALSCRCIRSVTEFGVASACSSEAALLALLQHLQIVDNMCEAYTCPFMCCTDTRPPTANTPSCATSPWPPPSLPVGASSQSMEWTETTSAWCAAAAAAIATIATATTAFSSHTFIVLSHLYQGAVAQAFKLITAGCPAILTLPVLRAFCQKNSALQPLLQGEMLLRTFNCADRRCMGYLSEEDVCLACSGRFKWRRYASLWRAVVCEAVRLCNRGVPSSVMPPVFEPTPKLLARDVFEGSNILPNSRGISLSKRLCQRTSSPSARAGECAPPCVTHHLQTFANLTREQPCPLIPLVLSCSSGVPAAARRQCRGAAPPHPQVMKNAILPVLCSARAQKPRQAASFRSPSTTAAQEQCRRGAPLALRHADLRPPPVLSEGGGAATVCGQCHRAKARDSA